MKRIKHLFTALLLLFSVAVNAHDFEVGGIYYKITSSANKTVAVTYRGSSYSEYSNEYTGSVVIPESVAYNGNIYSVTSIGERAFYDCSGLTSVTIGNSVTSIGESAFFYCSGLTSVTIGNSVTSIGKHAFYDCYCLTSIVIPNSVTSIGRSAFEGCTSLKDLRIEDGVGTLSLGYNSSDEGLFYDCPLETLYLGRNLSYDTSSSYGYSPFYNKTTLASVTIGNNVTSIGENAFRNCSGLTSVVIGNSVTSIGNYAFNGCTSLKDLRIEDGEGTLSLGYHTYNSDGTGKGLFYDCPLETLYLGRDLSYNTSYNYGNSPFYNKSSLTSVTIGNNVTSIGHFAFFYCSGLTSIEIPNSVTSIGASAFRDCSGLKSVEIPNSVTSIGNYAFSSCSGLTSIVIPNSVTSIGDYAFYKCTGLTSIKIPNSVTSFGECAFARCSGLTSVEIPNSVTSIGNSAFSSCSGLTSIEIPNSVTSIGRSAFSGCSGLTSIEIPNSVTSIGNYAFSDCSGLTSVVIGNSVTSIGNYAFNGCTSLKDLRIEDGEGTLSLGCNYYISYSTGKGLFYDCPLKTLYLGRDLSYDTTEYYGYSPFYNKTTLKSVTIGKNVTSIGDSAFRGCSGLTSIVIPNSVTSIEWNAFDGCSRLTSVVIPNSVTSIGRYAFRSCTSLKDLRIEDGEGTLSLGYNGSSKGLFYDCPLETLYLGRDLSYSTSSSYGYSPFYNKTTLKSVTIGKNVTSIGDYAFYKCSGLKKNVIPNSVTSIGSSAFSGCSGLTSVVIGNSVTSIGGSAFYGCSKLTSVVIGNSVTSIGGSAFYGCSGLTSIEIPNSVTSIGGSAFEDCSGLKTVINYSNLNIEKGSTSYGYIAYYAEIVGPSVSLNKTTATITEGETVALTATITPSTAADKTVTWVSDNEEVATVENGVVTAVKAGTATITATAGNYSATCVVTVEKKVIAVTGISLDKSTVTIIEGERTTLVATVAPNNATDKTVTWTTSDASIATVEGGVVTAVKAGTATITAIAGNYSATCVVTVEKKVIAVTGISLDKTTATIIEGETETLTATVIPSNATDQTVIWTTSDASIATVEGGVVTAVKAGTATITATAGNYSATCVVTVEKKVIAVTGISLNKTTATIIEGETETLVATVAPSTATDQTVIWTTSDASIATVSNGVVTAVKAGTATITATAGSNSATCVVTVEAKEEPEETAGLIAGINYRIKHNTTGYYMTVVSTESSNHDAGGVQIKTLDKDELDQVFILESVAENSYKIKSINGYYLSSFASWGYKATVSNSDAAIHQFTEVEESVYTLSGYLGYIGSNSDAGGGKEEGAWIYSNHGSTAQNIYWVFEPLTAEENKGLVALQTAEAMNSLERSIAWGKEIASSRAAVLSDEEKTSINTAVQTAENEKGNTEVDVDEEIARLNALAEAIDTAVENAIYIWSIDEISNTVCYVVSTENSGSWYSEAFQLNSTKKLGVAYAVSDSKQQFAFVKSAKSGKYYLYSVGEEKFVAINGSHTTLVETPEMGIVFLNGTRSAAYPWVVAFDTANGEKQISVSNGYDPGVITFWNSLSDSGNTVRFEKAAAFDATAALSLIKGYESGVTGISLDKETITITEGETETLVATVTPADATDKTVTWTTSNSAVATVSNGVVTALSAGTATITATAGGHSATCVVTVKKKVVAVTGITLDKKTLSIIEGERTTLVATVAPNNATDKTVTWTTSNSAVATVSNGVVTALSAGTVTITATAGNYSATCVVTVEKKVIAVTGISLNKTTATITEGETETLVATVTPADATDNTVTWTTSDASIATVEGGVVTAVKAGTTTITATAGNHSATCVVTVEAKEEPEEPAGLIAGINYRIKHNTTGYYMTVVSTESSNHDAGGVQIKALDKKEREQVFTLESVAENSYKIKSINGYYLSSFASWGYKATVSDSDAAIHQFTEVEEGIYTLSGNLGYIGSNSNDRGGKEEGAWIYSNHGSTAQNIYWVFEPLTAEENKGLVALQTAEAMNSLERSIVWGKEIASSRAAVLSNEEINSIDAAVQTAENEKGNACGDVDEEIARLTALAEAIYDAVENAIYIWSIDGISNTVCYVVSTENSGSWYSEASQLNSTKKLGVAYAVSDSKQQFAFVKSAKSGKYYLYSVGEEKFVAINGSHTTLVETPEMGIVFLNGTRSAAYPWVVAFDTANGEKQISVSNGYDPGVITFWNNLSDSGNTVRFEKAAVFDAAAALSLVEGYESESTCIEAMDGAVETVYDLNGRRIVDTEYLEHGVYIINGKKVVK